MKFWGQRARWPFLLVCSALLAFLVGGLMPGALRGSIERQLHLPFELSPVAHALLFAVMAIGLRTWRPTWHTLLIVLPLMTLGVLAEVAQFWIPGRTSSWADLGLDLAGVLSGLCVAALVMRLCSIIRD